MVATPFLAAGIFDKSLSFEIGEATLHCRFRIGRVRDDFCGPASGMLLDIVEHSISVARSYVLEWDDEGRGYSDKILASEKLDQIFDGATAREFIAVHRRYMKDIKLKNQK